MKPSICILMTVFSLLISCESRENKDAQVDRRPDLAPSYVAVAVFDVRHVTFFLVSSFCLSSSKLPVVSEDIVILLFIARGTN